MELLKIESLVCGYERKEPVLRSVSFSVEEGEFLGIVGPNGSGKTTLLRVLSRALRPSSGRVLYGERDLFHIPLPDYAREISFLPAQLELCFSYTVKEFVSMGRFPFTGRFGVFSPRDREIVEDAMRQLEISHLRDRTVQELSEGEKQRAFLAQVIAQQPRLMLLDEPTSHLDIGHQFSIMDLLMAHNRAERVTVVVILHDLNLAAQYCDRVVLVDGGTIAGKGTPEEVLTYQAIERAYRTRVLVYRNPITGKPHIFGLPAHLVADVTGNK